MTRSSPSSSSTSASSSSNNFPTIFVTVGTTDFDEMIAILDSADFVSFLELCGCKKVVFQIGRGKYEPKYLVDASRSKGKARKSGKHTFEFEYFRYAPSLKDYMKEASLIISHGGAGSIRESLRLKKPLMACVNESLMDNHQLELAHACQEKNWCAYTTPHELCSRLSQVDFASFEQ